MSLIRVRVADPTVNQVALWERHPAHPGGEVFIAGAGEFEVAATPAVEARLRNGRLVQVETSVAPASAETSETAAPEPGAASKPKKATPPRGKGGL